MGVKRRFVIGVDVGTGSARAGVFDLKGKLHGCGVRSIRMWRPQPDFVEQSSKDIWRACCRAVKEAVGQAGASAEYVCGIAFDATCSLVCLDERDQPLTVSPTGCNQQNVIVWMDHRAVGQASRINATGHRVLRNVGGVISPEMQPPKLLWLKDNLPRTWSGAGRFFDLADFLTCRATGTDVRSLCTTVCKWTYRGRRSGRGRGGKSVGGWDDSFWRRIDLADLVEDGYRRIGRCIKPMGEPVGAGLTATAGRALGLNTGTPVGVGMIDAHAGGLAMIGARIAGEKFSVASASRRLALIGGTSSCHMAVSPKPRFIRGVWGPYYSAMVPGLWLTEGGQSATGALIDHCIDSSAQAATLRKDARRAGVSVYEILNDRIKKLAKRRDPAELTAGFHVLGYHHGNRSPRADALVRGMVSGLTLNDGLDELAVTYLATIQSIAYGTRHIIESMNRKGYDIDRIIACGGDTKNPLFLKQHADITGCPIHLPGEPEAVLLGSAVLAAVAARAFPDCLAAMGRMIHTGRTVRPAPDDVRAYHARKYEVFKRMYTDQRRYGAMMTYSAPKKKPLAVGRWST